MRRARVPGGDDGGKRHREPRGSTSRGNPADASLDVPARADRGARTQAMKKVKDTASTVLDSARSAPRKASSATRAVANKVTGASRKTLESAAPLADWVLSTGQGLLVSELSRDLNGLLANAVKGSATLYDKAMDAQYLATHIGGGNHRLFDAGHTVVGAFEAVRKASPDDTIVEEALGYLQAMFRDMTTPKGLPLANWDKASYDQVAEFLKSTFGIPKEWFYDLNS